MYALIKKNILPLFIFFGFFVLYFSHMARSIYGGDVGDLVTAASVHGVAHPSGYPLFTFVGFLLVHLFFWMKPAQAVGMISVFSASFGVVCMYLLSLQLTHKKFVSIISACIGGFSFLYFLYAEVAEVFALNVFFALALFYLAILYRQSKKVWVLFLFFFALGLSLTNHQTIILIIPSLFLLIAKPALQLFKKKLGFGILCLVCALLGLTPFLYIPIAAATHPLINWDNVHNLATFFHLILRKDYGTFQAGIFDTPSLQQRFVTLQTYLHYLIFQLTIPVFCLSLFGLYDFFRKDKGLFWAITMAWILSGPAFLTYAGFPLTGDFILGAYERFALLSSIIFLLPFSAGLLVFTNWLVTFLPKRRNYMVLFQSLFLLIPLMLFFYNSQKTNLSHVTMGENYARDFLNSLPPRAVLLISGDTEIFNTWYVHYVLHDRLDVLLYNIGATPVENNSIVLKLENVPDLEKSAALIALLENMQKTRPVFSVNQFQPKHGPKIVWVPYGLSFKMFQQTDSLQDKATYENQINMLWHQLHVPSQKDLENKANRNLTIVDIPTHYADALVAAGTFIYTQYKDSAQAFSWYEKAKQVDSTDARVYSAIGVLSMTRPGQCGQTAAALSRAIALDAYQPLSYFLLYQTFTECMHNQQGASEVAKAYAATFQKNFQKDFHQATATLPFFTH